MKQRVIEKSIEHPAKALLCMAMSVILVFSLSCFGAAGTSWADSTPATVSPTSSGIIQIGESEDGDPLYYLEVPETDTIVFSDLTADTTDVMIAQIQGDGYVQDTDTVTLDPSWATSRATLEDADFILDDTAIGSIDLDTDTFGFWVMDADYEMTYYVIKTTIPALPVPTFTITAGDTSVDSADITPVDEGYSYTDYTGAEHKVPLYTVTIPADCSEVDIALSVASLLYNYKCNPASDFGGSDYLAGAVADATAGSTAITGVKVDFDNDGNFDFLQVQRTYNADYTGGDLLYAITFERASAPDPEPTPEPAPEPTPNVPTDNADGTYTALMSNIAQSYVGTSNGWQAMDLAAMGNAANVDVNGVLAAAKAAYDAPNTTNLQASILALTALGYDASAVTVDGQQLNLIQKMAETPVSTTTLNGQLFALLAYNCNNYAAPPTALMSRDDLIAAVENAQLDDGGFAFSGTAADPDMTAMAIAALQPYAGDADVSDVVKSALDALKALQNPDGGWGGSWPAPTGATNANSTAFAVIALCAAGVNPATDWATADGHTPLGALLAQANADNTGFLFNGVDNVMATEQGFRALVAYQGLKNTGNPYNIYTQAKAATAGVDNNNDDSQTEDSTTPVESPFDTANPATSTVSKVATTATAKTDDATSGQALVCVVLCALMIASVAGRRSISRNQDR